MADKQTLKNLVPGGRAFPIDTPANAPARFGSYAPVPKVYRIDLGSARTSQRQGIGGSFIWAYQASDVNASVDIQFNSQQADAVSFTQGMSIGGLQFSDVYLTNTAQAGKWIDLFVIVEGVDMRAINPANTFTSVTVTKPTDFATVADVTVTAGAAAAAILAANADRRTAVIQSDPANSQDIRIGDSNTGAARGIVLEPGDALEIESTDVIYAYTAAGADQTLHVAYTGD